VDEFRVSWIGSRVHGFAVRRSPFAGCHAPFAFSFSFSGSFSFLFFYPFYLFINAPVVRLALSWHLGVPSNRVLGKLRSPPSRARPGTTQERGSGRIGRSYFGSNQYKIFKLAFQHDALHTAACATSHESGTMKNGFDSLYVTQGHIGIAIPRNYTCSFPNLSIPFALLYQLRTRTPGKTTATGRLVFWLVFGELDRKPERELGKLEEVRKRETGEVHTAVPRLRCGHQRQAMAGAPSMSMSSDSKTRV